MAKAAVTELETIPPIEEIPEPLAPVEVQETVDVSTLPPLYPGMIPRASYVRMAQEMLCAKGYPCMIHGVYDVSTVAAVQRLQNDNNLTPNGVVGVEIWRLLTS